MRIIYLSIVLLFMLSLFVVAECPDSCPYDDVSIYDVSSDNYDSEIYTNTNSYTSDDFYLYSDSSQWDVSQIDYSSSSFWQSAGPDFDWATAVQTDSFWATDFSDEGIADEVSWMKIIDSENFNFNSVSGHWDDLSETSAFHYDLALSVQVDGDNSKYVQYLRENDYLTGGQRLTLNEGSENGLIFNDGSISTEAGGHLSFSDFESANGFRVKEDGEILITFNEPVENFDTNAVDPDSSFSVYYRPGSSISDPDGRVILISGDLKFENGVWSVSPGDMAEVRGLTIFNRGDNPVFLYLGDEFVYRAAKEGSINDGVDETLVYLGDSGFEISRDCTDCNANDLRNPSVQIRVEPNNHYGIEVDGSEGYDEDNPRRGNRDRLLLSVNEGSLSWDESDEELIVSGSSRIQNGERDCTVDGALYCKTELYNDQIRYGTVPLDVRIKDLDGNTPNVYTTGGLDPNFSFGNENDIDFGDTYVFSIEVDPNNLLRTDRSSGTARVINNLGRSGFKEPILVISTPGKSDYEQEVLTATTDLIAQNLDLRFQPIELNFEDLGSNSRGTYSDIFAGLDSERRRSNEPNELEGVRSFIVGHSRAVVSGGNLKYDVYLGVDTGGVTQGNDASYFFIGRDNPAAEGIIGCAPAFNFVGLKRSELIEEAGALPWGDENKLNILEVDSLYDSNPTFITNPLTGKRVPVDAHRDNDIMIYNAQNPRIVSRIREPLQEAIDQQYIYNADLIDGTVSATNVGVTFENMPLYSLAMVQCYNDRSCNPNNMYRPSYFETQLVSANRDLTISDCGKASEIISADRINSGYTFNCG